MIWHVCVQEEEFLNSRVGPQCLTVKPRLAWTQQRSLCLSLKCWDERHVCPTMPDFLKGFGSSDQEFEHHLFKI